MDLTGMRVFVSKYVNNYLIGVAFCGLFFKYVKPARAIRDYFMLPFALLFLYKVQDSMDERVETPGAVHVNRHMRGNGS